MIPVAAADRCSLRSVWRSHVGRVRTINEDRVFDDAEHGVWAVADGMGGHNGGDLAAQEVINCLRRAVTDPNDGGSGRITGALRAANRAINTRNSQLGTNAGTTAVAATFSDGALEIVWAGDSRAYRLSNGGAEQLTRDHSVVQQLIDAGLLTQAAAPHHPHAHVITRALGVEPDIGLDSLRVDDAAGRFLLCSDGLSRSLNTARIPHGWPLAALSDWLIDQAIEQDGSDNISLVLIDIVRG